MTPLRVDFVGTGTALPAADRYGTATLLRSDELTLLVDIGPGTLQTLAQLGVSPHDLDALLLTHAHLDHVADLFPLLFALSVPGYERRAPMLLMMSTACARYLQGAHELFGKWIAAAGMVRVETLHEDRAYTLRNVNACAGGVELKELRNEEQDPHALCTLKTHGVAHTESSLGYRLTFPAGPSLAIPGDTGYFPQLAAHLDGTDLLILECAVEESDEVSTHLHPLQFADVVTQARPRACALTHRYPQLLRRDLRAELSPKIAVPLLAPRDGSSVEFGADGTILWQSDASRGREHAQGVRAGAGWYE